MANPELSGSESFEPNQARKIVFKRPDFGSRLSLPESRFDDRFDTRRCHGLVIVGRPRNHVNVRIDVNGHESRLNFLKGTTLNLVRTAARIRARPLTWFELPLGTDYFRSRWSLAETFYVQILRKKNRNTARFVTTKLLTSDYLATENLWTVV